MKRYISLLLALVMVVGLIPTIGALAAEENTTPAVVEENFDDIALEAPSVDSIPGFTTTAAQFKPAPDRTGTALWVGDEAQAVKPELNYTFESTSNVTVEFEVNPSDENSLNTVRIYNDTHAAFTNTSLVLNFSNQGLRYYNGSAWTAYDASVVTPKNQWSKIRIELVAGKSGEAKIFVNDVEALTIPGSNLLGTMASKADTVNGIYFAINNVNRPFYLDNLKITPAPYVATYTPSVACDFESMTVDAAPTDPALEPIQATVVARANGTGKNAVKLEDVDTALVGNLRIPLPEKTDEMVAEFDFTYWKSAAQFWISNGAKGNSNLAYWLKIAGKNVQYYSGSAWVTLKTLDAVPSGWMKIRIEADLEGADFYIDGELIGTAERCSSASYGTNVTDGFDSLIFVCGGANAAAEGYYIDNVSLTGKTRNQVVTPSAACDFESMTVDAAPTDPALEPVQATVVARANGTASKNALKMEDVDASLVGNMRMALPEKTGKMVAEFNLTYWKVAAQFWISNGAKSNNNMAYWLKIAGKNVQYYSGSAWVTLTTMDAALSGWNKIRIEADLEGADIYINDELMGTAARCTGGSYGTKVTDSIDSLIFVCGGASTNNEGYYVDDVKLTGATYDVIVTPEVIEENFDDYYACASVENVEGIVASKAAEIVANPSGEGNALMLHDKTGAAFGSIDYAFDLVDSYILEYDAFIPTSANDVCMQILAGQGDNKTAYILAFNRAYGLRVLTGSADTTSTWVNLDETNKTKPTPNAWNKIRVEVNTGENNEASIYLNDQLIAVTSEAYGRKNDLVGANIYSGAANQYVYIDNLKVTVVESEDEGIDGIVDTEVGLMLEQDVTIDTLTIDAGTMLDLNGFALSVTDLVVYGSIIDTSEGSTGKVISENALFLGDMEYMPIYDSANSWYKFYAYELKNLGTRKGADGNVTYGFAIDFANADAYALLASGDCGVKVNMNLAWGDNSLPFVFDAALVQQYAGLQAKYSGLRAAMMLTVSGVDTLEAGQTVTVTPAVEAAGMADSGDAMVYTVS